MRSALLPCLATMTLMAVASPIEAQHSAPSDRPFITGRALGGAFLGAVGGGLLGGVTGFYSGGNRCVDPGVGDTCHYLAGLAIGTAIGVTVGTPIGAHYLTRRRGNFGLSL